MASIESDGTTGTQSLNSQPNPEDISLIAITPSHASLGHLSEKVLEPEQAVASSERLDSQTEGGAQTTVAAAAEPATADYQPKYPHGVKLFTVTIALCLAVFLVALDITIIATAIPHITDEFHALEDVGWFGSAYLLTTCSFQLLFGKLYSALNIKWIFLATISIFELGSLLCGIAPSPQILIIGRAIAGLGSAGIFSGALIIIAYTVPLHQRPVYTGVVGAMYGIASVVGPLMGGLFTDRLTWRWCFYINLPIGAVAFVIILIFFKSPSREKANPISFLQGLKLFDPIGTCLFIPAIVCLLLALQLGGSTYHWSDAMIIALLILFGVLILAFIGVQIWQQEAATIPPRIASQRSVAGAVAFAFALGSAFFVYVYYLPIWFQAIKGTTATGSGVRNLPLILSQVLFSVIAGVAITKIGYFTPFMYASTVFMAIGAGFLTTFTPDTAVSHWIGYQIIFGIGTGLGFQLPVLVAQAALNTEDVAIGISFVLFLQLLGGAIFVSVGQSIFTNTLIANVASTIPDLSIPKLLQTGITQLPGLITPAQMGTFLDAYNGALIRVFEVGLVLACLTSVGCVFIEWISIKGQAIALGMV